jgi:hypothetical protein
MNRGGYSVVLYVTYYWDKHPMGILLCTKKHVHIEETPCGYTFMHKKHVRIEETPCGYTFMHKKHVHNNERSIKG